MLLASSGGGARREMIPRLSSLKFQLPRGRSGVYVLERERERRRRRRRRDGLDLWKVDFVWLVN